MDVFFCFVVYLTMLSVTQSVYLQMVEGLMNSELERMRKGVMMILFEILSW